MKALGLLLLRSGFSLLVAVWAAARIVSPEGGIPLFVVWLPEMQPDALSVRLLGGLGVLLAVLVLTGFFRLAAYPLLVLGFLAAAVSAWPFPGAPLDLVAGGPGTFLLLAVLAVSVLMPLLFLGEDRFALDRLFMRRAPAAAALEDVPSAEEVAPAAEAPAAAAPAGDPEPAPETAEAPAGPPVESQVEVVAEEPAAEPAAAVACEVPAPAPAAESAEPEKTAA
ncbi:MAG: hypothetical protein CVT81_03850 [Alphaproteobacteria bacterium HGW-Alphaproteobacteria-3]|nr:MAG: hypothetical protein CVT81_03850 [Alphaproteobacteria bacterium HGW-Alphaproteobacteria-3]